MTKAIDLTGRKFGWLEVTSFKEAKWHSGRSRRFWYAFCHHCGRKDVEVIGDQLYRNMIQSCGCLRRRTGARNPKWRGHGEISGELWDCIKRKDRGYEFNITIAEAWDLFLRQERRCALSGIELQFGSDRTASLDRIDSTVGYVLDNIQWVHKDINIMKNDYDQAWFVEVCERVSDYQRSKNVVK